MVTSTPAARLSLKPGRKERLGDQLYGQILEQIVSGSLSEGERLPSEKEICRIFAVSRPVVREALMRLQADGLVSAHQGIGTFVLKRPPPSLMQFAEAGDVAGMLACFELRIAIESEAAALAATRRTDVHLAAMQAALDALHRGLERREPAIDADLAFHRAITAASGNSYFAGLLESLCAQIERWMGLALNMTTRHGSDNRVKRVYDEHTRILDAIRENDPELARLSMRRHLERARRRVTDHHQDA
jgi:DNA-binding FadR family transcriptional regulator